MPQLDFSFFFFTSCWKPNLNMSCCYLKQELLKKKVCVRVKTIEFLSTALCAQVKFSPTLNSQVTQTFGINRCDQTPSVAICTNRVQQLYLHIHKSKPSSWLVSFTNYRVHICTLPVSGCYVYPVARPTRWKRKNQIKMGRKWARFLIFLCVAIPLLYCLSLVTNQSEYTTVLLVRDSSRQFKITEKV